MSVVGLGQRIDTMQGLPSILPGLAVPGAISDSFQNAAFAIRHDRRNGSIRCWTTHDLFERDSA